MLMVANPAAFAQPQPKMSRPQRATIYRDGYAVLEEKLSGMGAGAVVQLPAEVDLSSVRMFQVGRALSDLRFEELVEEIQGTERIMVGGVLVEKPTSTKQRTGYLLRLGRTALTGQDEFRLRYSVTGINWQPQLEAEVQDAERVALTLTALVTNRTLDLRDCHLRLASGAGGLPSKMYFGAPSGGGNDSSRAADLIYELGQQTVEKDRPTLLVVSSAVGGYQKKYIWNTDTRERVRAVLMIPNPLTKPLCPAPANLIRDGVLVSQDQAEWAPPKAPIVLSAGYTPDVEIERSVETTENLANKARPFRHAISFKVANRGSERIRLDVVMTKKLGSQHKTLYRFKREPDRRPGTFYIWELDLTPGKGSQIDFSLDSEYPRFSGYEGYEKASYEMF
jgi:hypothetical protein